MKSKMMIKPRLGDDEAEDSFEGPLGGALGETLGDLPEKKETVLLIWRDLSMELVQMDVSSVKEKLDRLS